MMIVVELIKSQTHGVRLAKKHTQRNQTAGGGRENWEKSNSVEMDEKVLQSINLHVIAGGEKYRSAGLV
ncbi:MAG TPA: hypothetical protein ENN90_11750 [Mariniphaga anaerophila]|uniref:Uncharacterized protein n=1 Tax=Mariniphaga anaerophila TaxID=1484053 RepID=A0A831LMR6_9BACT|nr:hypothetical protein [Mariniphaga anaerophila]